MEEKRENLAIKNETYISTEGGWGGQDRWCCSCSETLL